MPGLANSAHGVINARCYEMPATVNTNQGSNSAMLILLFIVPAIPEHVSIRTGSLITTYLVE